MDHNLESTFIMNGNHRSFVVCQRGINKKEKKISSIMNIEKKV